MQFAQIRDRIESPAATTGAVDLSALVGGWVNSNPLTSGIARIVVTESDGNLSLRAFAIGPDGLIDWGPAKAAIFTSAPMSRVAAGFTCCYDFGFAETRLQGMIMKGLLVLAQFHIFKDGSGRLDYFVREYYGLEHAQY